MPTINTIHQHLWMAGVPNPAAPLHRQILRRRAPEINEDPNAHLVWEDSRILIKTLPSFLLDHDFWKAHICQDDRLYRSACGLLWSYTWLISHESDLRIAKEHGLVSDGLTWDVWVRIVDDFLDHFDDDPTDHVDERYQYGELKLSRIGLIFRLTPPEGYPHVYRFIPGSDLDKKIAIVASFTVVLSAMQVGLSTDRLKNDVRFQNASYGFTIVSLVVVAVALGLVPSIWLALFITKVIFTLDFPRRIHRQRRKSEQPST